MAVSISIPHVSILDEFSHVFEKPIIEKSQLTLRMYVIKAVKLAGILLMLERTYPFVIFIEGVFNIIVVIFV